MIGFTSLSELIERLTPEQRLFLAKRTAELIAEEWENRVNDSTNSPRAGAPATPRSL